ncbi:MAG: hypothetical protein OER95_11680 [Acidimicrobiia bacterium]|nr:hypothetical protein [Acidimicrobiia bacterium]
MENGPSDDVPVQDDEPVVDWRSRVSTAGLIVGSAMIGLERVFLSKREKDETEQVDDQPLDNWPRLSFGTADLEQLGPDDNGYWPT